VHASAGAVPILDAWTGYVSNTFRATRKHCRRRVWAALLAYILFRLNYRSARRTSFPLHPLLPHPPPALPDLKRHSGRRRGHTDRLADRERGVCHPPPCRRLGGDSRQDGIARTRVPSVMAISRTFSLPTDRSPPLFSVGGYARQPDRPGPHLYVPMASVAGDAAGGTTGVNPGAVDFAALKLHPLTSLQSAPGRTICDGCARSRRYWCCDCSRILSDDAPTVKLPLRVEICQSNGEQPKRSTAQHASMLSSDARVWRPFPACAPDFEASVLRDRAPGTVALLYPSDDALTPEEAVQTLPHLTTLVVVDANWHKSVAMSKHAAFASLPRVKLSAPEPGVERGTRFWRYSPTRGAGSPMFNEDMVRGLLSTIEAIHAFVTSFGVAQGVAAPGDYDNLLWLFAYVCCLAVAQERLEPAFAGTDFSFRPDARLQATITRWSRPSTSRRRASARASCASQKDYWPSSKRPGRLIYKVGDGRRPSPKVGPHHVLTHVEPCHDANHEPNDHRGDRVQKHCCMLQEWQHIVAEEGNVRVVRERDSIQ
jgi:DTW domain